MGLGKGQIELFAIAVSFLYDGFGFWALAFRSASGTPTASVCLFPGNWSLQILATLLGVDSHVSSAAVLLSLLPPARFRSLG